MYYGSAPAPQPYGPARQKHLPEDVRARKLFICEIGDTNEETFYNKFKEFGEIEDYVVQRNPDSGSPKGFGFVVYKDIEVV